MIRENSCPRPMQTQDFNGNVDDSSLLDESLNQSVMFKGARLCILDDEETASIDGQRLSDHANDEYSRRVESGLTSRPLAKRFIKVVAKVALVLSMPIVYVTGFVVAPFYFAGHSVYQKIQQSPVDEITGERNIDKAKLTKKFFQELAIDSVLFPVTSAALTKKVWQAGSEGLEKFCPSQSNDARPVE